MIVIPKNGDNLSCPMCRNIFNYETQPIFYII